MPSLPYHSTDQRGRNTDPHHSPSSSSVVGVPSARTRRAHHPSTAAPRAHALCVGTGTPHAATGQARDDSLGVGRSGVSGGGVVTDPRRVAPTVAAHSDQRAGTTVPFVGDAATGLRATSLARPRPLWVHATTRTSSGCVGDNDCHLVSWWCTRDDDNNRGRDASHPPHSARSRG